jgi:hypothetical protein
MMRSNQLALLHGEKWTLQTVPALKNDWDCTEWGEDNRIIETKVLY